MTLGHFTCKVSVYTEDLKPQWGEQSERGWILIHMYYWWCFFFLAQNYFS